MKNDNAVSEVIAVMLLISIAVLVVGIIAVFFLFTYKCAAGS